MPKPPLPPRTGTQGRPYALTDEVRKRLIKAAGTGIAWEHVARCAGIHPATLQTYRNRGRAASEARDAEAERLQLDPHDVAVKESELPFLSLFIELKNARSATLEKAAQAWIDQFGEHWTAPAEYLHRRGGPDWQRSQKIEHAGKIKGGGVQTFKVGVMLPELGDESGVEVDGGADSEQVDA